MAKPTHIDARGATRMVDVSVKPETTREARAEVWVRMSKQRLTLIETGGHGKSDVIAVTRIAGIQAARRRAEHIPLCHPLMLSGINLDIDLDKPGNRVHITTACRLKGWNAVEAQEVCTNNHVAAATP